MYLSIQKLLNPSYPLPKKLNSLDSLDFDYQGIQFHVYGILHGLSGGTNKEYVKLVNQTILNSKGLKLSEKDMKKLYQHIDYELDDWIQIPFIESFLLTFNLFRSPLRLYSVFRTFLKEKFTLNDRFGLYNIRRFQDIGGSSFFHLLEPFERRILSGFPMPKDYFQINIDRRNSNDTFISPVFPDPDWHWLNYIEKYSNIPFRSIHMLEYALLLANKFNMKEVSLFVGEIHNTDIIWYINDKHNEREKLYFKQIQTKAIKFFSSSLIHKYCLKFIYLFYAGLGFLTSVLFWYLVFLIIHYFVK